ncbi:MAG: hypothetical protein JRM73_00010 [Nitrososphaerota archaeon]|nr:hypothetical protein [Nitrososphaerota archaeon]
MSSFSGLTPILRLALRNDILGLTHPLVGTTVGIVDTGFDGFVAVPEPVFDELGMDRLSGATSPGKTADGKPLELRACLGTVYLPAIARALDGQVLTGAGVDEILVGTKLLRRLRATLDYCTGAFRVEPCR